MICIELLILRAPVHRATAAAVALSEALTDREKTADLLGCFILRHKTVPGDIALLLEWQSDVGENGSILGQQLKPFLADFGIVSHSVWIHEER